MPLCLSLTEGGVLHEEAPPYSGNAAGIYLVRVDQLIVDDRGHLLIDHGRAWMDLNNLVPGISNTPETAEKHLTE